MRFDYVLSIILLFSSVSVLAQDYQDDVAVDQEQVAKIQYVENEMLRTELGPPNDEALVTRLEKAGLVDLTDVFEPVNQKLKIAHVLSSPDFSKMVTLRYDFVPKDSSLLGQTIKLASGRFVLHTKTGDKRHVAILFEGFKQTEINPIALKVTQFKAAPRTASARLLELFVPKAHAAAPSRVPRSHECHSGGPALDIVGGRVQQKGAFIARTLAVCSSSFMTAISDSLDIGVSSFFTGEWISGIKKAYTSLKYFITNGTSALVQALGDTMSLISGELFTAVLCYAASTAAANVIMSAVTGGVGVPMMMMNMLSKIKKVASVIKVLTETRVIRNVRYLSSKIEGKTPEAHLREGDLLTLLPELKGQASFIKTAKETQTVQTTMTQALRQSACVVRLEAQSQVRQVASNAPRARAPSMQSSAAALARRPSATSRSSR